MSSAYVLALDQGTTSTRAIVFDAAGRDVATARRDLTQHYPCDGWVEHDPEDIWRDTLAVGRQALAEAGVNVRAIGIANQRETTVLWDRMTGMPVYPAVVWQDRRTADRCTQLRSQGAEELVRARTGLLLDPYFSATKLAWLLDHQPDLRARAARGELAFGTVDCFLLWRLTEGRVHATDATNASRTLLFDIHRQCWDEDLLHLFDIPRAVLPQVRDSGCLFGHTTLFGGMLPIAGIAGDQQAALIGQGCVAPGMMKSTFGTGCFALLNTGGQAVVSRNRMLTTVAYRLDGTVSYALEGAIFVAGAAVKWLRDGLGLIAHAAETNALAARVADNGGVYLVPAFVGLGAPHWAPDARAMITGLTFDATGAHIARAALESVAYQMLDLAQAMASDRAEPACELRVDGGMAANDWFCQFLADVLDVPVQRPAMLESTALGAAVLAGLATGLHATLPLHSGEPASFRRFAPRMIEQRRQQLLHGWRNAMELALAQARQPPNAGA
jgi:glycerol kinase